MDPKDKVALVTGAAQGIVLAIVKELLKELG
jgi:Dehydrogenases with different specificities (related to short-chain alcohol dehydrogenases)